MRMVPLLLALAAPAAAAGDGRLGGALYAGGVPLQARLLGHTEPLPDEAARCSNCHGAAGARRDAARPFAPALNREHLLQPQRRRGGPPSRYDEHSFCRALRDGIDPAWVTLPRAMPRYRLDDAQCAALWSHLTAAR